MPKQLILGLVTFLHDLFTAIWIGGMLTLVAAVLPAIKETIGQGPEMQRLLQRIQDRLSKLVYLSIVGLAITGILLSRRSPAWQGFLSTADTFSALLTVKHILFLVMIAIALIRSLALKATSPQNTPRTQKQKLALLLANAALGILVLLLSGLSAAWATTRPLS